MQIWSPCEAILWGLGKVSLYQFALSHFQSLIKHDQHTITGFMKTLCECILSYHGPQLPPPTRVLLEEALRFSNIAYDQLQVMEERLESMSQVRPELQSPLDQPSVGDVFPHVQIREIEGALKSATILLLRAIVLQRDLCAGHGSTETLQCHLDALRRELGEAGAHIVDHLRDILDHLHREEDGSSMF